MRNEAVERPLDVEADVLPGERDEQKTKPALGWMDGCGEGGKTHCDGEDEHDGRGPKHALVDGRALVARALVAREEDPYRYRVQHEERAEEQRLDEEGDELQAGCNAHFHQ